MILRLYRERRCDNGDGKACHDDLSVERNSRGASHQRTLLMMQRLSQASGQHRLLAKMEVLGAISSDEYNAWLIITIRRTPESMPNHV